MTLDRQLLHLSVTLLPNVWSRETLVQTLCLLNRELDRHRLQSHSRILLKEKGKFRHCKRKSSGLWLGGTEAPILFKEQFISCKSKR
jgi:hypothetical protein